MISRTKWYTRVGYTPRVGQALLEEAAGRGCRYLSFFAFPRAGKSYGAAKFVTAPLLNPDCHVWIVAPTYELGSKEFGYIWEDALDQGFLRMATSRNFDVRGGNMKIKWPWGSFVQVVSADNPKSLRAEELDYLILAEASQLDPDLFDRHLFARVEKRKGITLVPTTPHGYNWVYHRFRIPSLPEGHKDLKGKPNPKYDPLFWSVVVSADPELGDVYEPGVYDLDYIARAKKILPRPVYLEQVGGSFASYAGTIYKYDPDRHRCKPFDIPSWWTHIAGWDHGANDPTSIHCGSINPDGHVYWWGEIYTTGKTVRQYSGMLDIMLRGKVLTALATDPSAKQIRIELAALGVTTVIPKDKQVESRIIRTTELLNLDMMHLFEGSVPHLEAQLESYEWDEDNPGKPRPGQEDHAVDAIGYALLSGAQPPVIDPSDPDVVLGETPEQTRMWRGFRKRIREEEEEEADNALLSVLDDNPFEEQTHVADFDMEAY